MVRMTALVALLVCSLATACAASSPVDTKPNFVVLFVDDLGMNQVNVPHAPYGYTGDGGTVMTPAVARLANEGMLFTSWYSSFHVCSPSRASMMTGRYSIRAGVGIPSPNAPGPSAGGNEVLTAEAVGGLPLNETTTAEALKEVGYATMAIGKWHLGQRTQFLPASRGFEKYLGIPYSQDMGISFWEDLQKPHEPFQPGPIPLLSNFTVIEQPVHLDTLAERYTNAAADFISENAAAKKPFYLYLAYNHVHAPNSCSPQFCGSTTRGPVGDAVAEMDNSVRGVLQALDDAGVTNDTLIIYTSDNGAPLGNDHLGNLPLRDGKASTWEGGFREPGIARWPGKIPAGSISTSLVGTIDIHPTLLTLGGAALPTDRIMDGKDLTAVFTNPAVPVHDCIFYYASADASNADAGLYGVRCGNYKAYWNIKSTTKQPWSGPQNPPLLFDVENDHGETVPINASTTEYQMAIKTINTARAAHLATITPVPNQNGMGSNYEYALCGDPNSKSKYPQYMNCTITPDAWKPAAICDSAACMKANPAFGNRCKQE